MKTYLIADPHFGHAKIIDYCQRPFASVEEMDKALIKNWNKVVTNKDTIIVLGDFALGTKKYIRELLSKLNGKKILVMGNHDRNSESFYRDAGFETVSRFPILYAGFFLMSHAPLQLSETTPYFNCYGHVHNDEKYADETPTSKCFSVERTNYMPVLFLDDEAEQEEDDG